MQFNVKFEKDVAVPMRDGTILRANVFRPRTRGRYPGILVRTPYGKADGGFDRFVLSGYAVVVQDVRGRYASDGEFVPFHVENTGEEEDGYDSVEWLAEQPYCNGRVGTMGASYCSWTQWALARLRPPHLVAMCAYSIPTEHTELDWPGAFRAGRRVHWWINSIAPDLRRRNGAPGPTNVAQARRIWYDVERGNLLHFLPWSDLPHHLPDGLSEYVADWLAHPNRKAWRFREAHSEIEVPNLDFTGYYDHCCDTIGHLRGMQEKGRTARAREQTRLVVGPWNHVSIGSRKVGDQDFGPSAEVDVQGMILRWFDHWLKGVDNGVEREPPVEYFVLGSGRWRGSTTWPPPARGSATYYLSSAGDAHDLAGSGTLSLEGPGDGPPDEYTFDPRDPVPTLWKPDLFTIPSDRRSLDYRADILRYRTEAIRRGFEVVGHPEVHLFASSDALDTDFFGRLVDEIPGGPALELCYGMVRARYRHTTEEESLLEPGKVEKYLIRLGPMACRFSRGHRIRLEITSSDFPSYDRNHNTGRNDLFDPRMVAARQTIHHSTACPSRLVLPLSST